MQVEQVPAPPEPPPGATHRFVDVSVAGTRPVAFCIDPEASDPVAAWFAANGWIDEPVQRAFLGLVRPGARVLDLGCHLGTFSLAAAALGAEILAVDAAPEHVRLLSLAAARNGFENLVVRHGAIAPLEDGEPVAFLARSIHGHVCADREAGPDVLGVPAVSVDRLLDEVGWENVDVVKMDIEGSELAALRGMERLFGRGGRPAMVVESNAGMLSVLGGSVVELRTRLAGLGYELLLIDHLRPGVLVETTPEAVQTESASDLLVLAERPAELAERWRIQPALSLEATTVRVLDAAASPAPGYRRLAAGLLRDGPAWLRSGPGGPALVALDHDVADEVRAAFPATGVRSPGFDYLETPAPRRAGPPPGSVAYAEGLAVTPRHRDLERPLHLTQRDDEIALRDLSFHLNRAEPVALLSVDRSAGQLLLDVLCRRAEPVAGSLHVLGDVVSLSAIDHGLEPALAVRDNVISFAAFLGCHVPTVEARLDELLARFSLAEVGDLPLRSAGSDAALRLAIGVGLECSTADLLLIGDLPVVRDPHFAAWARARAAERRAEGTAIFQAVRDASQLVIDPVRALWLDHGTLRAAGHAESVLETARLEGLGLLEASA